jgi:hypothetical protein
LHGKSHKILQTEKQKNLPYSNQTEHSTTGASRTSRIRLQSLEKKMTISRKLIIVFCFIPGFGRTIIIFKIYVAQQFM